MAEPTLKLPSCHGLSVELEEGPAVAALRYFERTGHFAHTVLTACGVALPETGGAVHCERSGLTLAWRSPTETWCLAAEHRDLARAAAQLEGAAGGCCVDLTGGIRGVRLSGSRISELLCRLGGTGCVPAAGESRRGRLAEVAVQTLSLRDGETRLLVERYYLPHLLAWIRETLADFADA
jgi:hypothetical protein